MNRITIILPWPDSRLMPNRKNGRHWGVTQEVKVRARQEGYLAAKAAAKGFVIAGRVNVGIMLVSPDKRLRDIDNMVGCLKHYLDGIAKALGTDDRHFRPLTIDERLDIEGKGFVIVEIG